MSCPECGFDEADWDKRDRARILRQADRWLAEITDDDALHSELTDLPRGDLHGVQHLFWRAGRARWAGMPTQDGVVAQVNSSAGGVPKLSVPQAFCGRRGLEDDRQSDRRHHGSPLQALCLWSADVIDALRAEGHPIAYGSAGENVTVRGLDWAAVGPGQRVRIGPVLAETSGWAVPCRDNARWFVGGDFRRMSHPLHPGWSRVYARVLEGGPVSVGDPVEVEPS